MKRKISCFLTFFIVICWMSPLLGNPPRNIPEDLLDEYTLNGQMIVYDYYFNNSYKSDNPIIYTKELVNSLIKKALAKQQWYYGDTDTWLYEILDRYPDLVKNKTVGIIGSVEPWYESIVLAYGGNPVTIEYNKIISDDNRLNLMTVEEYKKNPIKFDVVFSISSIEHDGLGRYGDPLNPWGDILAMQETKKMLNSNGILILSVPVGKDALFWNAHRVYGQLRLPLILNGWELIESRGYSEQDFERDPNILVQPIFILIPTS